MSATKTPMDDGKKALIMPKKNSHEAAEGHPSADNSGRWPDDQALREFGFVIYTRPKNAPARWTTPSFWRKSVSWTFEEALLMMQNKQLPKDDKK